MPLIRTIQIDADTKLGVWKITEDESFFRTKVNISRDIHHLHKRLQHFAGRYLLLTLFPDFPIQQITVTDSRKPVLACDSYHFSISHCGDYAAAIVSKTGAVGIDIEEIKEKIEWVSHKFLSPEEQGFMDLRETLAHKSICWSAKEAMYKWYGKGGVDFKADMRLYPFVFQHTGFISAEFLKPDNNTRLYLQYIIENNLCLAWTLPARGLDNH
ncbi:4'-phosphopantetheinyl transferase family protein [Chitinophaga nivalis]|uniref:4'-phosphopantetheinyl transferase superfamily protein n=1 Tax=Chitinophaga nivalis TaxID=2991709 RepID=A0ABT3IQ82_9BACT|nr:4'-phosphopantetheinyl transferase superfamily protein [Chitinophaga nivalis]MCW3464273.1 4'-phosphopantetheinyl transferase superfamily protein [Chitinophaga nivalis]MCW3486036.1 4'-phosphopantetheinyl transferase superfamily protein [Chitinophaga nivalis]